jgi:hypothetical protein
MIVLAIILAAIAAAFGLACVMIWSAFADWGPQ